MSQSKEDSLGQNLSGSQSCTVDASSSNVIRDGPKLETSGSPEERQEESVTSDSDEAEYPKGLQLWLIISTLFVSIFTVAVSQTVLAPAIPTITSAFKSSDQTAWYSTGEQITAVAFQLPFGQAYSLLSNKWIFFGSIVTYLVGSAVCGAAPSSMALIIGRVIQGIGMAGVFGGAFIILACITPLRTRSLFAGLFGAAYAIASVVGPIMGGSITSKASWRWCFYFNLPIGAAVLPVIAFCLPQSLGRTSPEFKKMKWTQKITRFDPLGTTLLLTSLVCLILSLEWGGSQYAWSNARVIGALVAFAVTLLPWMVLQYFQGEEATVPLSMIKQRSIAGSNLYLLFLNGAFGVFIFYLPVWYQVVKGDSAETSGLKQLALCISTALTSIAAGSLVAAIGFYNPFIILGSLLTTAGSALCIIIKPSSALGIVIGGQILVGAGVGAGAEQANVAVQAVLPADQVAKGTSLILFTRLLGMALSVPIAQSVFQQELVRKLGGPVAAVLTSDSGLTDIRQNIDRVFSDNSSAVIRALEAVNYSLTRTFMLATMFAAISFPFGLIMEWKSVKQRRQ